jgi:mannose-6-phosphate isomerase-like protein (cupin superfamily)
LRRGVFLKRDIEAGEVIGADDVYFAFPPEPDQITANDWSKYTRYIAQSAIKKDEAVSRSNTMSRNDRERVFDIAKSVKNLLQKSNITVPGGIDLEISHHYGLERFSDFGLTMLTVVNRGYCKKILVCLPGQTHPEQYHQQKEETFHILFGELTVQLNGVERVCKPGDVVNIEPGVRHGFTSTSGA